MKLYVVDGYRTWLVFAQSQEAAIEFGRDAENKQGLITVTYSAGGITIDEEFEIKTGIVAIVLEEGTIVPYESP